MNKVYSQEKLPECDYRIGSDGIANIWIRKNSEESVDELGNTNYVADEVYFRCSPDLLTIEMIKEDIDYIFDAIDRNIDPISLNLDNIIKTKKELFSQTCKSNIENGIDVKISRKLQHFSLTDKDQINLLSRQLQLIAGADQVEYHQDGSPYKFYSANDMNKIISTANTHISYQTAYCNALFQWLEDCKKISEAANIQYGDEIPKKYQSDVLKSYLGS